MIEKIGPTVYKGDSIYNMGAGGGGGGGVYIEITEYQGSRRTPTFNGWPDNVGGEPNRVSSQVLYLNSFVGKKLKISAGANFLVGAIDGIAYSQPFNDYSWADEIELTINYGVVTISVRKSDNSNITPDEVNITAVLLNE